MELWDLYDENKEIKEIITTKENTEKNILLD